MNLNFDLFDSIMTFSHAESVAKCHHRTIRPKLLLKPVPRDNHETFIFGDLSAFLWYGMTGIPGNCQSSPLIYMATAGSFLVIPVIHTAKNAGLFGLTLTFIRHKTFAYMVRSSFLGAI